MQLKCMPQTGVDDVHSLTSAKKGIDKYRKNNNKNKANKKKKKEEGEEEGEEEL